MDIKSKVIAKLAKSYTLNTLKKGQKALNDEEKKIVKSLKATWNNGDMAIKKSVLDGKTYYFTNTHRAMYYNSDLKKVCQMFHKVIREM